jgi:hypothetical protein
MGPCKHGNVFDKKTVSFLIGLATVNVWRTEFRLLDRRLYYDIFSNTFIYDVFSARLMNGRISGIIIASRSTELPLEF